MMKDITHTHVQVLLLAAAMLLAMMVVPSPAQAAIAGDEPQSAFPSPGVGVEKTVPLAGFTASPNDPRPTCLDGSSAAQSVWFHVPAMEESSLLRVTVTTTQSAPVIALYPIQPAQSTQMGCNTGPAGTQVLEQTLARGVAYFVMVGSSTHNATDRAAISVKRYASDWNVLTPLPTPMYRTAAFSDGGNLYIAGGITAGYQQPGAATMRHSDLVLSLQTSGRWKAVGRLPRPLSYHEAAVVGNTAYMPGGRTGFEAGGRDCTTREHYGFDMATRTTRKLSSYTGGELFDYTLASDESRGRFLMIGGAWDPTPCDVGSGFHDLTRVNAVRSYTARTDIWTDLPPLQTARSGATAVTYGDWIIVAGGMGKREAVATTEVFASRQNRWYQAAPMPIPSWGSTSTVSARDDGTPVMLVVGGWTHMYGGLTHGLVQEYDISRNTWTVRKRRMTARESAAGTTHNGFLVTIGGWETMPMRTVEALKVDSAAPKVRIKTRRSRTAVAVRIAAQDPSGIAQVRARRIGGKTWKSRRKFTCRYRGGSCRLVIEVTDRAGNTKRVRMKASARGVRTQ